MIPLAARGVVRAFGGLVAVDGVDLTVPAGQVTALIGPNGAGKSTLFACLAGQLRPDRGRVLMAGVDVTRLAPDARARRGLARTFQRLAVFGSLTVADNVRIGAENAARRIRGAELDAEVAAMLDLLGLTTVAGELAATLPTGTLRLVELARALVGRPSVVLLDEPTSGLDDAQTSRVPLAARAMADEGRAVVIVEHDLPLVFAAADVVHVLARGRIVASGTPAEVQRDPALTEAFAVS
ncbi:MAG TPA: ABC transporter ATP-binding protein [Jatrophihabitantaceae bacterium]